MIPNSVIIWAKQGNLGLQMSRKADGSPQWATSARSTSNLTCWELGDEVEKALIVENRGAGWLREDEILGRATAASTGMGFMDFLTEGY